MLHGQQAIVHAIGATLRFADWFQNTLSALPIQWKTKVSATEYVIRLPQKMFWVKDGSGKRLWPALCIVVGVRPMITRQQF